MGKRTIKNLGPVLYQLTTLSTKGLPDHPSTELLQVSGEHVIAGELGDHIIVSVSPGMSYHAVNELATKLSTQFKREVLVVTHNIQFLITRRLSYAECLEVEKRLEVVNEDGSAGAGNVGTEEVDPASVTPISDGDRSGVCDDGPSDTGTAAPSDTAEGSAGNDVGNAEVEQKAIEPVPGNE